MTAWWRAPQGPGVGVTITACPLLPELPALGLRGPERKAACLPFSILLTFLLPRDTVIFWTQ